MGYRSDVSLCLTKTGYEKMLIFDRYADFKDLLENSDFRKEDTGTGSRMYCWQAIKWYPFEKSYLDICGIDDFINTLDSDEYHFVRLGEDNDDTETLGNFFDNPFGMTLCREIYWDGKNNPVTIGV